MTLYDLTADYMALQEMMEDDDPDLEKKDHFALWVSGMITVALPCLLMIVLIMGVTMLLFGR